MAAPSGAPTSTPTAAPSAAPSGAPTATPTTVPSEAPTAIPTGAPTAAPSSAPTAVGQQYGLALVFADADLGSFDEAELTALRQDATEVLCAALSVPVSAAASVSIYSGSVVVQVCFNPGSGVDLTSMSSLANDINNGSVVLTLNASGTRGELILTASGAGVETACTPAPTTAPTIPPFCGRDDPLMCADVVTTDCADDGLRGVCRSLCGVCVVEPIDPSFTTTFPIATTSTLGIDEGRGGASSSGDGYDTSGIVGWVVFCVLLIFLVLYMFCKCWSRRRTRSRQSLSVERQTMTPGDFAIGSGSAMRTGSDDEGVRQSWDDYGHASTVAQQRVDAPNLDSRGLLRQASRSSIASDRWRRPPSKRTSMGGASIISDVAWDHYEVHHAVYRAKRHNRSGSRSSAEGVDRSWSVEPSVSAASRQLSSASPEGEQGQTSADDSDDEPKGFYETAPDLSEVAQASAQAFEDSASVMSSSSDDVGADGLGASSLSVASAPGGTHGFQDHAPRLQERRKSSTADMSAILRFASAVSADELERLEVDIQSALAEEGVELPPLDVTGNEGSTDPSDLSSPAAAGGRSLVRHPSSSSQRIHSWSDNDGSRSA